MKKRKAQQLVEFAITLPILMAVLLIIIEFGQAIIIRIMLTEAVKSSVFYAKDSVKFGNGANPDGIDQKQLTLNNIQYLVYKQINDMNIPYSGSIDKNVTVELMDSPDLYLLNIKYIYTPFFKVQLPFNNEDGTPAQIPPNKFEINVTQALNKRYFMENGKFGPLVEALQNNNLNNVSVPTSILKTSTVFYKSDESSDPNDPYKIPERRCVAFLYDSNPTDSRTHAKLFDWWGDSLLPDNLSINYKDGYLYVLSPYYGSSMFKTGVPYTELLVALGFTDAFYTGTGSICTPATCDKDISSTSGYINNKAVMMWGDSESNPSALDQTTRSYKLNNFKFNFKNRYLLKVHMPTDTKPPFNPNGFADGHNILNAYLDNDGDKIPNAWDKDPNCPDADGNGILDGAQSSITPVTLPDKPNLVLANVVNYENYTIKNSPFILDGGAGILNSPITHIVNGYTNNMLIPKPYDVYLFHYKVTDSNGVVHPDAIYYQAKGTSTNILYGQVPDFLNDSDKLNFIYSDNFSMKKSIELEFLLNGPFSSDHKATSTNEYTE